MPRPRGGALEQNEEKPKNSSRAPPSWPILMTNTLKDRIFFTDSASVYIMTYSRSLEVKLGSNRQIKVKLARLAEMYPTYICIDLEFCQEFRFYVISGQFRSSEVKLRSNY